MKTKGELLDHFWQFITPERRTLFEEVVRERTRYVTVAVENIYQPHNASAVLRSCDCFGVQDVHIIENSNKYEVNPDVALGASKWLTLNKYNRTGDNTLECIDALKSKGYKVYATSPHRDDHTVMEMPLDSKIALLFGTEGDGLSDLAMENADGFVKIPMYGFTESFNISVSAAICLSHITDRLRNSDINWRLSDDEHTDILLSWVKETVKRSDLIEKSFLNG